MELTQHVELTLGTISFLIVGIGLIVYAIVISMENRRLRDDRHNFNNLELQISLLKTQNELLNEKVSKNDKDSNS